MKKILAISTTMLCIATNVLAQNPGEDNGLGMKIHFGSLNMSGDVKNIKGGPKGLTEKAEINCFEVGVEFSNRWYVWHNEKVGIAVEAHWADFSLAKGDFISKTNMATRDGKTKHVSKGSLLELSYLGVSPMFTYYLGKNRAIDGYYVLTPYSALTFYQGDMDGENFSFLTLNHKLGAAYRWRTLQTGLEYALCNTQLENNIDNDKATYIDNTYIGCFKVFFGFKF